MLTACDASVKITGSREIVGQQKEVTQSRTNQPSTVIRAG